MTRVMVDATHNGLPAALPTIKVLAAGDLVALYDTGSAGIAATVSDLNEIPSRLGIVLIDQGFTGSPNLKADVRDCENGGWLLQKAVNKTGWNVARPTLYLGFPNTAQQAFDAGWRGDVWLVMASSTPPINPPTVPVGLNVVGIQWNFTNPNFDVSTIFDPTWPEAIMPDPTPIPGIQPNWLWCNKCQGLFHGPGMAESHCPAGGTHDGSKSFNYSLPYVESPPTTL